MKKTISLIIYLHSFFCSSQTGIIQGNIFNRIEKTPGSSVLSIIGTKLYLQADLNGNFKFEKVKPGTYSIKLTDVMIGGDEIFTDITVTESTTTYLNIIIPRNCIYENTSINHKICPICLTEENTVPIQQFIPLVEYYKTEGAKQIIYEYEKYNEKTKTYDDCKLEHPDCYPMWYCVKDKVKF